MPANILKKCFRGSLLAIGLLLVACDYNKTAEQSNKTKTPREKQQNNGRSQTPSRPKNTPLTPSQIPNQPKNTPLAPSQTPDQTLPQAPNQTPELGETIALSDKKRWEKNIFAKIKLSDSYKKRLLLLIEQGESDLLIIEKEGSVLEGGAIFSAIRITYTGTGSIIVSNKVIIECTGEKSLPAGENHQAEREALKKDFDMNKDREYIDSRLSVVFKDEATKKIFRQEEDSIPAKRPKRKFRLRFSKPWNSK